MIYVKLYGDSSATIDLLSDTEAGRLLKAIGHYINGQNDELPGQEKLVFAMLKAQFERDAASYDDYVSKQRENGKKGGRPKKPKGFEENPENPVVFSETQKRQDNNNNKDNNNNNNNNNNYHHHDDDARVDFNTIQVYAANNLAFMSPGNLEELIGFVEILPEDVIRFAIDEACANGAPRWAYVSAILRGYVKDGIKTVGDAKAAKDKRKTSAGAPQNPVTQTYQARGYTDADYGEDFYVDLSKENGG